MRHSKANPHNNANTFISLDLHKEYVRRWAWSGLAGSGSVERTLGWSGKHSVCGRYCRVGALTRSNDPYVGVGQHNFNRSQVWTSLCMHCVPRSHSVRRSPLLASNAKTSRHSIKEEARYILSHFGVWDVFFCVQASPS